MANFDWGGLLSGGIQGFGFNEMRNDLKDQQTNNSNALTQMQDRTSAAFGFKPWTVSSDMGNVTNNNGKLAYELNPYLKVMEGKLFGDSLGLLDKSSQDPLARQNQLYDTMNKAQAPDQQRQQAMIESALQRGGRGGMLSSMYGGSPEQLAYNKAVEEQKSKNWLGSFDMAQKELESQYTRGSGMMDMAYKPSAALLPYGMMGQQGYDQELKRLMNESAQWNQLGIGKMTSDQAYNNLLMKMYGDTITAGAPLAGGLLNKVTGTDWSKVGDTVGGWWDKISSAF